MARTTISDSDVILENHLQYGAELSGLYSSQCNELPSESVDSAILAAARREVGSGPGNRNMRKWQIPASMAAGLVFAVGMIAVLNQRVNNLEDEHQIVAEVAVSSIEQSAARQVQVARKKDQSVAENLAESEDAREQTLASAAAGADEQAVTTARRSMVAAAPDAGVNSAGISKLSFAERFKLLQQGLKPSQVAVLLGEPSRKEKDNWFYQRLSSTPGKSIEYQVNFDASSELVSWNVKQVLEQSGSPAK